MADDETDDDPTAVDLGNITTVERMYVKAVANALDVDTSYSAAFSAEVKLAEGESVAFKPAGTVYVNNATSDEKCTVEYLAVGT